MKTIELEKEIDKLGLSEKILLVEDIWDKIARGNKIPPVSAWQKEELDKRYADFKEGKLVLHDWKEVHSRIRSRRK